MERATSCYGLMVMLSMMMVIVVARAGNEYDCDDDLSLSYYQKSCPDLEKIIHNKVKLWLKNDSTLAPSLINLQFHDCAVRGCDASILLDHKGSERAAKSSKSLRGFELIDDIKSEVEKKCPRTVSCADILTAAARDATVAVGGLYWSVPYGRKDGRTSRAEEDVATGRERITDLIELFQSKGLNLLDLVVLSGAHSVGRSSCDAVQHRLFNYNGSGNPDPAMEPRYVNFLKRKCRWASESVELDAVTPNKLDVQYYKNLQKKMGLLSTDQMLYSDSRTGSLVSGLASQPSQVFHHQFAASMVKLGKIQDYLADDDGEIRLNCNCVNAA